MAGDNLETKTNGDGLTANQVFCVQAPSKTYAADVSTRFAELPAWARPTSALTAMRSLLIDAGLDREHIDSPDWNPLREMIQGKKVVLKPNWVYHENSSNCGLDCLITHTSVIEAILHYVVLARPKSVVLGDAPIQGCDFDRLIVESGVADMVERFSTHGITVRVKDFRRTIRPSTALATKPIEECRPLDEFVLYDLGAHSVLEEISLPNTEFRVTMYNPDMLMRTHGPGKHQYLVVRDVIESDVMINIPKLKTHKKACITGALKNVVGINGHKEYLPHHRKGNPQIGGDCYPEQSAIKTFIEDLSDAINRSSGSVSRWLLANTVRAGTGLGRLLNVDDNCEGSWHGNDTVWRMTLDLQRILRYGREDGTLANGPQRTVLTVTDAIVAGEGEGPMAPTPIKLAVMTLGVNTAAVEWVNALLMGLPPQRIALTREAFTPHRYALTDFSPEEISVFVNGQSVKMEELFARYGRAFRLPKGWQEPFAAASAEQAVQG
jgi:uncharacterized protein (DUF362 family)